MDQQNSGDSKPFELCITIYPPSSNLGCGGIRVNRFYLDVFKRNPGIGVFASTGKRKFYWFPSNPLCVRVEDGNGHHYRGYRRRLA